MARPLRLEFPGALYHVTARGDRREPIYECDRDRRRFLDLLAKEVWQQRWILYAYCLMDNHYHLLVETPHANLVRGMRRLNGAYTQAFNRAHDRVGHVLQGRYKAILVERESHLLELARYVVLNPVRAGLVRDAADYAWSSHRAIIGAASCPDWLAVAEFIGLFGDDATRARRCYIEHVMAGIGAPSPWSRLRGQIYLGGEAFVKRLATLTRRPTTHGIPRAQMRPDVPAAEAVLDAVAWAHAVPRSRPLDRAHGSAFRHTVYLLRRCADLSLHEVACYAGISCSRVSQIQHEIEAKAAAPELCAAMTRLQTKDLTP